MDDIRRWGRMYQEALMFHRSAWNHICPEGGPSPRQVQISTRARKLMSAVVRKSPFCDLQQTQDLPAVKNAKWCIDAKFPSAEQGFEDVLRQGDLLAAAGIAGYLAWVFGKQYKAITEEWGEGYGIHVQRSQRFWRSLEVWLLFAEGRDGGSRPQTDGHWRIDEDGLLRADLEDLLPADCRKEPSRRLWRDRRVINIGRPE